MDDLACASCRKVLSLEEIERGGFRHLGGRIYCAECVAKMRRVGPTLCPHCGTTDTPLYNGRTYACRKCGAELSQKPAAAAAQPAAHPKPSAPAPPRPRRPVKKCPYCGGIIPAESLKCRYCSSVLTRDAHDLEDAGRQNVRLRFWLGCLLSASVFLLVFLIVALARRQGQSEQAAAPAPPAGQAEAAHFDELARKLDALTAELTSLKAEQRKDGARPATSNRVDRVLDELSSVRAEIAAVRLAQARLTIPLPPKPRTTAPAVAKPSTAQPPAPRTSQPAEKTKGGNPPPIVTEPPRVSVPPVPKPTTVDATQPPDSPIARQAAAAYPELAATLKDLKAKGRYGEAMAACRQFLALYLGTPAGKKADDDQKALHDELDAIREDHARRFRAALEKKDVAAAQKIRDDLERYDAPEVREDRARMVTEIKAAQQLPAAAVDDYLSQWKSRPDIDRFVRELQAEDPLVRQNAAEQLARLKQSAAIRGLIGALHDEDWFVATKVIEALAAIGDPIALPAVAEQTKAAHPSKYDQAAQACAILAQAPRDKYAEAWKLVDVKKVAQTLLDALRLAEKEESTVASSYQSALLQTLAELDAKEAAEDVRAALRSKDPQVRQAAAAALKKLTGEDVSPESPKPPPEEPKPAAKPDALPPAKAAGPDPRPAITPPALPGKVELLKENKSIAVGLPANHGLKKGDRIEVAREGKLLCTVEIVQAEAARVLGNIVKLRVDVLPPAGTPVTVSRTN